MQGQANKRAVFVAGPPRSGTTMLTLMIASHPEVCLMPEVNCIPQLLIRFPPGRTFQGEELEEVRNIIKNDRKLKAIKADLSGFWENVDKYGKIDVQSLIFDLLGSYRDAISPRARLLGHKKNYLEIGDFLKFHLPEAKIVSIFRDPRDCAISAARNLPMHDIESAALAWKRRARQFDLLKAKYSGDLLEMNYERLLARPEEELMRLCRFLEIDFSAEMLEYYKDNQNLSMISAGQEEKHKNTSLPLLLERCQAWKKLEDQAPVLRVEMLCKPEMQGRGYEISGKSRPGFFQRARSYFLIRKDLLNRKRIRKKQMQGWQPSEKQKFLAESEI